MIYDPMNESYKLSTGRVLPANQGILGLSPEPSEHIALYDGYDGINGVASDYKLEERKEIAEFMIAMWKKFAAEGAK